MSTFQRVIKYAAITFAIILTVGIITGIVTLVSTVVSLFNVNDESRIEYRQDFSNIDKLDINNGVGRLTIKSGDGFRVEASNVSDKFNATVKDGTLKVGDEFSFLFNIFGLKFGSKSSSITVYVPIDFTARSIKIESGTGEVVLEDLSTEKLIIDAGVGDVYGRNITAKSVEIDGGVGDITLYDVNLWDVDCDSGVGKLKIEGMIFGDSEFDCGVGNVELHIRGNREDYEIRCDSSLGSIRVDGKKVPSDYQDIKRASNIIRIDGSVGDVDINFSY